MAKTKHVKLYSNPLNRFLVDLIWITKTTAPFLLITGRTEDSLLARVVGVLTMLAVGVHFSEQLKWSMEPVAAGCQDIPGIWLSVRQQGWVAKPFVPQMADQCSWLLISLAWRCHRVSSLFPLESEAVFYVVCVEVGICFFLGGGSGWDVQQVNVSMLVWCLTLIMYEMYVCMSTSKFDGALELKACAHT